MSKEITPPDQNIITGDVSRVRTMPGINFSAEVVNKEEDKDKIKVPTGRVVTEEQKNTTPDDMFTSTMEKIKTETETSGSTEGDAFLNLIDQGDISLNNLDFQYSSKDMDLMGKFDRLKLLRELRKDDRITGSRYISLKSQIPISLEEAAILESRELNRAVDPDEILKDPLLMNKYGLMELDAQLADSIQELQAAGVDVTAGAPANIRAEVGRFSDEESKLRALEQLQEDGQILFYKPSKLGMIITVPSGDGPKDLLLDEIGFSGKDFLDMTSEIPGIAANVAATTAAVVAMPGLIAGGTFGLAGLAAISGISYFAGATSSDLLNRAFTKNQVLAIDQIAKDRGVEAAMAAGLDFLLIGGFKLGKGIINKFIGPVAGSGDLAVKNYLKSIAQGKQVIQYDNAGKIIFNKDGSPKLGDIQLTPGLVTQSQTIQRIEGVTEKIPGSADVLQVQKDIIEKQLIELEQRARGNVPVVETVSMGAGKTAKEITYKGDRLTSAEVGENVSNYVSRELKTKEDAIAFERGVVIKEADSALDNVASSLSTSGNVVKTKDAGELVIDTLKTSKKNYVDEFDNLTKTMKELDNYKGNMTIDASDINKAAKKLEESFPTKDIERLETVRTDSLPGLPSSTTTRTVVDSTPILPKQLSGSILDDLKNVSDMTVDQAINFKKILKESYSGETLPTDADKLITQIVNNIDHKIQGAIRSQGPEVLQAYNSILNHEASKGGIFTNALIKKILDDGVEPENIFVKQILQGNEAEVRILTNALGKDNPILGDVKSAAFNEMLRKARSSLGADGSNPQILFDQIASLPESTQKFLLGKDYKKVKNLLNILAVERGMIDINQLSGMSGPLVTKLRKIVDLEKTAAKDYKNKIIKPFLKDSLDESQINPAKFVKYFLTEANPKELTTILEKFSPDLQQQIKKRVVQEILESGRSGDPDLILKEFATGQTPPHPTLYKALFKFGGGDEKLARQKLDAILGSDVLKLLEDVAGIGAAQRKTSDVAASAGGLVSGSIVANLMNLRFGNVASVIKYRIAAKILSSPAGVSWLTSQKQLPAFGPKTAGFGVASKEIFDLVAEEFANEPELFKTSRALLERNNAEYAERLEEDKAYKQMLIEKGGAVDIVPEFNRTTEPEPVEVIPSRVRGPADFQTVTGQPASNFAGVNTASRLANPNVFAPAGMVGSPTINTTMARGQQLFPDSITFAAQGGIVSAAKPKQRVI